MCGHVIKFSGVKGDNSSFEVAAANYKALFEELTDTGFVDEAYELGATWEVLCELREHDIAEIEKDAFPDGRDEDAEWSEEHENTEYYWSEIEELVDSLSEGEYKKLIEGNIPNNWKSIKFEEI